MRPVEGLVFALSSECFLETLEWWSRDAVVIAIITRWDIVTPCLCHRCLSASSPVTPSCCIVCYPFDDLSGWCLETHEVMICFDSLAKCFSIFSWCVHCISVIVLECPLLRKKTPQWWSDPLLSVASDEERHLLLGTPQFFAAWSRRGYRARCFNMFIELENVSIYRWYVACVRHTSYELSRIPLQLQYIW